MDVLLPKKNCCVHFGEKAGEVKDASRRAEPGIKGVVKTQLFAKQAKELKKEREKILLFQKQASERKS